MPIVTGWTRITSSGRVASGPLMVTAVIVNASVSGSVVTLYNSLDESETDIITEIKVSGSFSEILTLDWPVFCERGLYVKVGSNVDSVTVFWVPFTE